MKLDRVDYTKLNSKQKENYNYHIIAGKLAEYGYDCMRLNNDWQGADFIAVHNDGESFYKVQLKARLTFSKKYLKQDIWIAFIDSKTGNACVYDHDKLLSLQPEAMMQTESWAIKGNWSNGTIGKRNEPYITVL
jgi:hypothetical protein